MTQEHTENIHKNVQGVQREVLYTGKRVQREIQYVRVHNHKTGAFHHDSIALKTYRKSAKTDWKLDEKASISLSENHEGELTRAIDFVSRCRGNIISPEPPSPPASSELFHPLESANRAVTQLASGPLKQRMAAVLQSPPTDLKQALLLLEVAQYRQAVKNLHHLLKQPLQSAAHLFDFFSAYPELIFQAPHTAYTGNLPPHTLCFKAPFSEHYTLFYLADYRAQEPLFELNHACSAWVPTAALNTALGELSYELQALPFSAHELNTHVLLGDIAHDGEQKKALALYQQRQNYRIMDYSGLLKQSTEHLKQLQERLKQVSP
jgi:hypothetical protein